jgi:hypothetical protein
VSGLRNVYLAEWPFKTVPDARFCRIWAGRPELLKTWNEMFDYVVRRNKSTIYLIWGYYGAGKTHGLMHFRWKLFEKEKLAFVVYHEFPKDARNFLELYREFINNMDFKLFKSCVEQLFSHARGREEEQTIEQIARHVTDNWDPMSKALLNLGDKDQSKAGIAERWIKADRVMLPELKTIGISNRIETSSDAIRVLSGIIRVLSYPHEKMKSFKTVIWMIDEFQSLQMLGSKHAEEIKGGLISLFNASPNNLCLALAFKTDSPITIKQTVPDDMIKRLPAKALIRIPAFKDVQEAEEFILDLLKKFRMKDRPPPDIFYPFSEDAITETLRIVASKSNEITPREAMKHFDFVLDQADVRGLIQRKSDRIGTDFVREVLAELQG